MYRYSTLLLVAAQRGVVQGGVLAGDRVGDGRCEAADPVPLLAGARPAVAADLVDAPVDLEAMVVGIAEFDGELAAGAAASLEIDRHAVPGQMVAGPQH